MLGNADGSKCQAVVNTDKTCGMFFFFFKITQHGEVCTVDASVVQFACAVRTWKFEHAFHEHHVSDSKTRCVHRPPLEKK